mgnify:CR=1 FL=1
MVAQLRGGVQNRYRGFGVESSYITRQALRDVMEWLGYEWSGDDDGTDKYNDDLAAEKARIFDRATY